MSMVAPYFKMPIEQAFNYDLFMQRKIEEYPGETQKYFNSDVRRRLVHFSKLFRFVNEMDKLAQPSYGRELDQPTMDMWGKVMRQVFGAQKVKVNLEFGERKRQREIRDIMMYMKRANDTEYATLEDYLDELTQE